MKPKKEVNTIFIPARIRQARVSRGLSLSDLADLIGITKQAISQYELGTSVPSDAVMFKLVEILKYPVNFFRKPMSISNDFSSSVTFFRSRKTTSAKAKDASDEKLIIFNEIDMFLREYVNVPSVDIPTINYENLGDELSKEDIEELAQRVRKHWGLGLEPIDNLTSIVQQKGFIVSRMVLGNKKIDGFSKWYNNVPYIFLGSDKESAVRLRFSIAHELGHLLMHTHLSQKDLENKERYDTIEDEANRFAGAFLLPAEAFGREVYSSSINHFILLKKKWKVAISCMINRCCDLGLLSENQITYIKNQMTQYGYWRREPLDDVMEMEKPYTHRQAIRLLLENKILLPSEIVENIACDPDEIENYCFLDKGTLTPKVPNNLITLKREN